MNEKEREARTAKKKMLDQTLGISFCKLMELHPLYDSRVGEKLPVLLVGTGACLEFLRDKILANGQLLDTELEVTILTDDPERDGARLMEDAPELWRFVELSCTDQKPEVEQPWATVRFEACKLTQKALKAVLRGNCYHRYVLISTENPEGDQKIASIFPAGREQVVAWVAADAQGQQMLCVRERRKRELSCGTEDAFLKKLEPIAYNLHYAYSKGNNPHAANELIRKEFQKPYNYESNIECAIHIRSKLRCCGIDDPYDKFAADQFARKLEGSDGDKLLNRLALLEHRRWCISKLLKGFCLLRDVTKIYSEPEVGTHDEKRLLHVCLVPYQIREDMRRLGEQDWEVADMAAIDQMAELDELDKQTLRVHLACRTIKEEKRETCFALAEEIKRLARAFDGQGVEANAEQIRQALERMYRDSPNALFVFNQCADRIRDAMKKLPEDHSGAKKMCDTLDALQKNAGALIEYISRKDYKQQNITLVQQIPFALSKWEDAAMVKIMAEDVSSCVAAAWHMEPSRVVFVDFADSYAALNRIWRRARRIDRFLCNSCNQIQTTYHIFLSGQLRELSEEAWELLGGWGCAVHKVESGEPQSIRPAFAALMEEIRPDYIDLTGGKAELVCLAEGYAMNSTAGAFCIRDDRVCSFYGAKRMEYRNLHRGLTVQEMFDQSDAVMLSRDDQDLPGQLMKDYPKFWAIARDHAEHWNGFCVHYFAKAYQAMLENTARDRRDPLVLPGSCLLAQKNRIRRGAKEKDRERTEAALLAYDEILKELGKAGLLIREKDSDVYRIPSDDILSALRNSGKVLEYYIYCCARAQGFTDVAMSWMFSHSEEKNAAKNEVDVICTKGGKSLFISAKFVSMHTLKSDNFLNYVCYEIFSVAGRFGVRGTMVLAAPNVPMYDEKEPGELSKYVRHARSRDVYLLGDACFREDRLGRILENIAAGREKWYDV